VANAAVRGEANRGSHVLMRITPPLLAALMTEDNMRGG